MIRSTKEDMRKVRVIGKRNRAGDVREKEREREKIRSDETNH